MSRRRDPCGRRAPFRPFALLLALFVALWANFLGPVGAVFAQDAAAPVVLTEDDYSAWEKLAQRAGDSLTAGRASDQAFEDLRRDLVVWRSRFQAGEGINAAEVATLEARINALGPPPEEGETEAAEIADLREQLNQQLQDLRAPGLVATEAYTHVNSLVLQIDRLLRERQQTRLLERGASPLNPNHIGTALEDLRTVWRILKGESGNTLRLKSELDNWYDNLAILVVVPAFALLLLFRGRHWFQQIVKWMVQRGGHNDRLIVVAMLVSIGQVILPVFGLLLLVVGILATGLLGASGEALLVSVPPMGLAFFGARWLGGQTFPRMDDWPRTLDLTRRERVRGRFYSTALGVLLALTILLLRMNDLFVLEQATLAVLSFPVIVLSAICLAGLSRLLIAHGNGRETHDADPAHPDERSFQDQILALIGRAGLVFAFVAPFLALLGYSRAAAYCSISPGLTLGLLAMVNYLQRLAGKLFELFASKDGKAGDGLLPVLVNFALAMAALPLFALAWGVRVTDLAEFWNAIRVGIEVGGTRISPAVVLMLLVVFLAGFMATRLLQGALRNSVLPRTGLDEGAQRAVVSGFGYVGIFVAGLIAVSTAGISLSSFAIVAGALSVGVGFGLQNVVSNFVSGLILLVERPVTEGDWIEVGGIMGTVRKISVRATWVETFDRTDVIVPNSDFISNQVTNWTRGNLTGRLILNVGVAYGSDTRKVANILQELAEAHPLVIVNPPPFVAFQGFGADSLDFEMRIILRDINFGLATRTELNHQIAERFAEEGIEIPFAQRDIWLRNPEALRPAPTSGPFRGVPPEGSPSQMHFEPDSQSELPSEDMT